MTIGLAHFPPNRLTSTRLRNSKPHTSCRSRCTIHKFKPIEEMKTPLILHAVPPTNSRLEMSSVFSYLTWVKLVDQVLSRLTCLFHYHPIIPFDGLSWSIVPIQTTLCFFAILEELVVLYIHLGFYRNKTAILLFQYVHQESTHLMYCGVWYVELNDQNIEKFLSTIPLQHNKNPTVLLELFRHMQDWKKLKFE